MSHAPYQTHIVCIVYMLREYVCVCMDNLVVRSSHDVLTKAPAR